MRTADLVVLALYLAVIVGVGAWAGRRSGTSEAYTAARGRLPGWVVGLSIFGTFVSSISFLALPGKAYASDWNAFVFSLTIPAAAIIAVRVFVPFYRAGRSISSYEHLEARFGAWARTYAVGCYLLLQLARMGTIMYLLALALAPITGWSLPALIAATGLIVIAYTLYGGIEAVIWTDVVQSLVFIGGATACVVVLATAQPGGPIEMVRVGVADGKFSLGSFGPDLGGRRIIKKKVYGLFINLQNFGIDQSYVQRYQAASSPVEAARAVWLGALLYVPVSALFFLIGTGLYVYYAAAPGLLPADVAATPDRVFPHFMVTALPAGLSGLLVASVFAAAQSTISTSINSSATLVLNDLYVRYVSPTIDEPGRLRVLRLSSLVVGTGGTLMALAMMRIRTALDAWWQLAGIASGGMLGLFLLGLIVRRASGREAAWATTAGVVVIGWMTFSSGWPAPWRNPFHANLVIVLATLVILTTGWVLSRRR